MKETSELTKMYNRVRKMNVAEKHEYQGYIIYVVDVVNKKTEEHQGWKVYALPPRHGYGLPIFQSGEKPLRDEELDQTLEQYWVAIDFAKHTYCRGCKSEDVLKNAVESYTKTKELIGDILSGERLVFTGISIKDAVSAAMEAFNDMDHAELIRHMHWFTRNLIISRLHDLCNNE